MVRLREIPRTAAFAWSTTAAAPFIATGTKAGALDADFSSETVLEIWDLALDNTSGAELQPVGSVSVDSRFHALAWSEPRAGHSLGIIAGALENGSLDLWDAAKLQADSENSLLTRNTKHTGAVKALQFNPHRTELLASAGAKGELFITDLNDTGNSIKLGASAPRADDFDAIDWNKKVAHILVTGSSGGFATVWDVRTKKETINLNNYGRKSISAIAWDPNVPTKVATATSNDQEPVVLLWDLRNSNSPASILRGHDQGVLSLSWSRSDPRLLLSSGKDNRTICWNSQTGEAFGEYPVVTNWTFQTSWSPRHPGLLATASFDGKVAIQTIQTANSEGTAAASAPVLDGADFFASAQSRPQGPSFSLPVAPTWLERPTGVSFGFGGKLIRVGTTARTSKVTLSTFVADSAIVDASLKFEEVLQTGDLTSFCNSKISEAKSEDEKSDWTVIETLISGSRKKLKEYLGFSEEQKQVNGDIEAEDEVAKPKQSQADDTSFFDNADNDDFLSSLASSKGAKTNNPFQVYAGGESDSDRKITQALILGQFEEALDICLKEKRMSDAFMIAICGGEKCINKAKSVYFKQITEGPSYLRLLASVAGNNLWDVVYNADLKEWKEVMATICTYADEKEFPDLCEALGDRLEESISRGAPVSRKDASFCYLAGSKLEKVVAIWSEELQESEQASIKHGADDSSFFSIHATALHGFIEKITVFRSATNFRDTEQSSSGDWKLAPLYTKYTEYADILASQGQVTIAERYLDLLPSAFPAAEVAKNRVKLATSKSVPVTNQKQTTAAVQRGQRVVPTYQNSQPASITTASAPGIPYAPAGATQPQPPSTYAPPGGRSAYAAPGYQQPQQGYQPPSSAYSSAHPPQGYGAGYGQFGATPPPPRAGAQSPSVAPASKLTNLSQWNDTPDLGPPKPASRRGTPSYGSGPPASAYASQSPVVASPQFGAPPKSSTPVAPPPKAGAARVASPATVSRPLPMQEQRPPSSAANAYTPTPPAQPYGSMPPSSTIPRGNSPYNPPPAVGPPTNRYAPAPGSQPTPQAGYGMPPPQKPSPYATFGQSSSGSYGQPPAPSGPPSTTTSAPPPAPPPKASGPPRVQPPPQSSGPPRGAQLPSPQPSDSRPSSSDANKALPSQPKYPSGDRSHIPPTAMPVYEILSNEMQRIKSKAPAAYKAQVLDTEKRLGILFDLLNNQDPVIKPGTVEQLKALAQALQARQHDGAQGTLTEIMMTKSEEGSAWMVGVKRMIIMSKATPL